HKHKLGLAAVNRVAELPTAHCLPTLATAYPILGGAAALTGVAVSARRYGTRNYPLPFSESRNCRPEFLDHADRFVTHRQTFLNEISALQDMYVRAADRGSRFPNKHIERSDIRYWFLVQGDPSRLDEDSRLHFAYRHRISSACYTCAHVQGRRWMATSPAP